LKNHLDRIEVRTARRQKQERRAGCLDQLPSAYSPVTGEIVQDNHVAGLQLRHQHLLDKGLE
jgi:hypothetical protein